MREPIAFEFTTYKDFLHAQVDFHREDRGYKGRLAEAAGCNRSFISHVLTSHVELTPDHAAGLARLWRLDGDHYEYFLAMVMKDRAATPELKNFFLRKMKELRQRSEDLSKMVAAAEALSIEEERLYYSAWYWSAIHILLSVPGFQTPAAIAARLQLPEKLVRDAIQTMVRMGLVAQKKDVWLLTDKNVHTSRNALYTWMHHKNWRDRAVEDHSKKADQSFHYTGVHSLSRADYEGLKRELAKFLEKSHRTIADSKEETVCCLGIDFFEV